MTEVLPMLMIAATVALFHGFGGAFEKKGIGEIMARLGQDQVTWPLMRNRLPEVVLTALTTPVFVLGVFMAMILGGTFLMILLSMGDGAKTGIAVGALSSVVYVVANILINKEQLQPLHLIGIACAVTGSALIAAGGFES